MEAGCGVGCRVASMATATGDRATWKSVGETSICSLLFPALNICPMSMLLREKRYWLLSTLLQVYSINHNYNLYLMGRSFSARCLVILTRNLSSCWRTPTGSLTSCLACNEIRLTELRKRDCELQSLKVACIQRHTLIYYSICWLLSDLIPHKSLQEKSIYELVESLFLGSVATFGVTAYWKHNETLSVISSAEGGSEGELQRKKHKNGSRMRTFLISVLL